MGQDGIYLQVVSKDPHEPQQKNAKRVFDLLNKGKHWVLVTLLLSNVIVNESLPVVLDRCLGGGVAAVVGSTVLIVIFGEILPQSVCVRYGLQIGGYMSKPVLLLMYLMAPIAWPTAKLLDWILGEDHGTVYKKSGLKTLVTLHKSLGDVSERLNQDEVTIISAVLDLKAKPVGAVMTPMEDVFTLAEDSILDEKTMHRILTAGYSRIPIHQPGNPSNFVGMLLVRILITYDPEDCKRVSDFALATLPETRPETSCLDILNFFQEGKSHMVLVSENPAHDNGALGVVTLEDVIEELIGEEIIDESDVYIDIHKAIRRLTPAPKARPNKRESIDQHPFGSFAIDETIPEYAHPRAGSVSAQSDVAFGGSPPKMTTFIMRRSSAGADGRMIQTAVPLRKNFDEIKDHLKHLGPSNPATNPKSTKYSAVKIKHASHPTGLNPRMGQPRSMSSMAAPGKIVESVPIPDGEYDSVHADDDETTALLGAAAATTRPLIAPKDGVLAVRQSYGSVLNGSEAQGRLAETMAPTIIVDSSSPRSYPPTTTQLPQQSPQPQKTSYEQEDHATQTIAGGSGENSPTVTTPPHWKGGESTDDSIASLPSQHSHQSQHSHRRHDSTRRRFVRSGSITENVVEAGGVRKMVLGVEPNSDDGALSPGYGEGSGLLEGSGGATGDKSSRRHHSRANSILSSIIGRGKSSGSDHDGHSEGEHDDGDEEQGDENHGGAGPSAGGGAGHGHRKTSHGSGHKKKNRRKKRKGGK
ncbi:DUF21-domain-containing protein [Zalerion maritima]|uniref:DUF21-domain-containing protein n=1 Tax=Zalerion maritima TaxID=339359 RepID=A0AAD5WMN8_9PEZI|nr:DUF21-domain-containing protein [Zalerion maritima]